MGFFCSSRIHVGALIELVALRVKVLLVFFLLSSVTARLEDLVVFPGVVGESRWSWALSTSWVCAIDGSTQSYLQLPGFPTSASLLTKIDSLLLQHFFHPPPVCTPHPPPTVFTRTFGVRTERYLGLSDHISISIHQPPADKVQAYKEDGHCGPEMQHIPWASCTESITPEIRADAFFTQTSGCIKGKSLWICVPDVSAPSSAYTVGSVHSGGIAPPDPLSLTCLKHLKALFMASLNFYQVIQEIVSAILDRGITRLQPAFSS